MNNCSDEVWTQSLVPNVSRVTLRWASVASFCSAVCASILEVELCLQKLSGCLTICSVPSQAELMKRALMPLQRQGDLALPLDWQRIERAAGHRTVVDFLDFSRQSVSWWKSCQALSCLAFNPLMSTSFNPSVNTSQHLPRLYRLLTAKSSTLFCVYLRVCAYVCTVCVCMCCILPSTVLCLLYLPHCCDNLLKVVFIQEKW